MKSITTKSGDKGKSGLLGGARIEKTNQRFDAIGAIDELSAALGVAKAASKDLTLKEEIEMLQRALVSLGAEVATLPADFKRNQNNFLPADAPDALHKKIIGMEKGREPATAFVLPGDNPVSATLHVARTVCRRAERELWRLHEAKGLTRELPCVYLNRLGDLLWLMAEPK